MRRSQSSGRERARQIIALLGNMLWVGGEGDEPIALGVGKGHLAQFKNNRTTHLEMASRRRAPPPPSLTGK